MRLKNKASSPDLILESLTSWQLFNKVTNLQRGIESRCWRTILFVCNPRPIVAILFDRLTIEEFRTVRWMRYQNVRIFTSAGFFTNVDTNHRTCKVRLGGEYMSCIIN